MKNDHEQAIAAILAATNGDQTETAILQWPAPLKKEALIGITGELVELIRPGSEADDAALVVQFLTCMGNLIGRHPHFFAQGTPHYLNLFAVLVGTTSRGRKGSSFDQVMLPLRAVEKEWSTRRVAGGLASGEGLIFAVRDPIVKQEPVRQKGRVVGYQVVMADQGEDDKRILIVESEFSRTLQVIERDTNTLSAVMRQAWDHGKLGNLVRNNPLKATDAHVSIVGHITKAELDHFLTEVAIANGFANRFLWTCVRRSKLLPEGGRLHHTDWAPMSRRLLGIVERARQVGEMARHPSLREQWAEFYKRCAEGGTGLFDSATSRAEPQTMRLACLYALLDQSETIQQAHLDAAMAVWQYCEDSARFLFGNKIGDPTADQILAALREVAPAGLTRWEISNVFDRHKAAPELDRALGVLQGLGLARSEEEKPAGGGRPALRWFSL